MQTLVATNLAALNAAGIGRGDRVAMVLPNGPETACAFLAVAAGAVAAPLNPGYRAPEFEFYLSDLNAKALLIQTGMDSPARQVAARLAVPVIELIPNAGGPAGDFALNLSAGADPRPIYSDPNDQALVLHTSGTTSRPKIVPLSHGNLGASAHNIAVALALTADDLCLNIMPLFHIHGLMAAVMASLTAGAGMVCSPGFDRDGFWQWLRQCRPTWFTAVPTMHMAILETAQRHRDALANTRLRFIRSSSAALPPQTMADLERLFEVPLIEAYGMTEAAHQIAGNPLPPAARKPGSVGSAAGPEIAVMDAAGSLLPRGATGEIVIRGDNVAAGYENNPQANAAAYADGWFRTGDQGRIDDEGYLYLTGRLKEIINRGGEKVAPREVDEALLAQPEVSQAAAFAVAHRSLGEDVAAAVVLKPHVQLSGAELRQRLFGRLAAFKIPNEILIVDEIPKGPTGKVQRIGLADKLAGHFQRDYAAPRDAAEESLAGIYEETLGRRVGIHDNFFSAGGDSLGGARLVGRIRDLLRCDLPIAALFRFPTVAELAREIGAHAAPERPAITRKDGGNSAPLSAAQRGLWLTEQLEPEYSLNNVMRALHLDGAPDQAALQLALSGIAARHDILRTAFSVRDGEAVQTVVPRMTFALTTLNIEDLPAAPRGERLLRIAESEACHSFDLAHPPLFRALLIRLAPQEHVLIVTLHHIVSDGWSMGIFSRELEILYRSALLKKAAPLPEPAIRYSDYAVWQRDWLRGAAAAALRDFWKRQLANAPRLELPLDRPYSKRPDYRAASRSSPLSAESTRKVRELGLGANCTLFMTLFACFSVLLHRYTGETDIVIGAPTSGRHGLDQVDGLIGFFVNTLALRADLSGNPSFRQLLGRVRGMALESYRHAALPFDELVEALRPGRRGRRNPLFDVMINFHEASWHEFRLEGLRVEERPLAEPPMDVALSLDVMLKDDTLHLSLKYQPALFDDWRIDGMLGHLIVLLEGCAADPERRIASLPLLSAPERRRILDEWNETGADYPRDKTIHALFERQAQATPGTAALLYEERRFSYADLNRRANQLAHHLIARGVGPDTVVGIGLRRSPEMIVGLLAILKAGGAYLPLDPDYPAARLSMMAADAGIPLLLTHDAPPFPTQAAVVRLDGDRPLIERMSSDDPRSGAGPDNLAYVIYTSGSTGKPKGVPIHHRALVNYIAGAARRFGMAAGDRILQFSTISFDTAAEEIFTALTTGATLVLRDETMLDGGAAFLERCRALEIGKLILPTAFWHELTAQLAEQGLQWPDGIKLVIIGGEQVSREKLAAWLKHAPDRVRLINAYGPTETTIAATMADLCPAGQGAAAGRIVIGAPLPNIRAYILDQHLQPVPAGIAGELHIGGDGVSRGYLDRPELTAERFIADPFRAAPGARLYKTGDRARYLPDGNIEYLGRDDHQIKLRGFRIELGEIAAALRRQAGVRDAVVVLREDRPGNPYLAAYLACGAAAPRIDALQAGLREELPPYMVPNSYALLDALPLTQSGKIDRNALPAPPQDHLREDGARTAPRTPYEKKIAAIWREVMASAEPGLHDDFFELGGHSLLAIRIITRVNRAFNTRLPLRALFESPTVGALALALAEDKAGALPHDARTALLKQLEALPEARAERLSGEKTAEAGK